jgi:hypothetical protein
MHAISDRRGILEVDHFLNGMSISQNAFQCFEATRTSTTARETEVHSRGGCGITSWGSIAECLPRRIARQWRDRWNNYLSPSAVNGPWTSEDEELLCDQFSVNGPSWRRIALVFPTRREINVKSRWPLIQHRIRKNSATQLCRFASPVLLEPTPQAPAVFAASENGCDFTQEDNVDFASDFEQWF